MAIDSFETEIPLAIASSLQDELERAVQHRFVTLFLSYFYSNFSFKKNNSAAQDRNTDQLGSTVPAISENNLFQSLNSDQSYPIPRSNESLECNQQESFSIPLIRDKSNLREAFQRIKIAGDCQDMSHIEDLEDAVGPLLRAMVIREKYDEILFF